MQTFRRSRISRSYCSGAEWEALLKPFGLEELRKSLNQLTPQRLCKLLDLPIDAATSLELFHWAGSQPGYAHSSAVYHTMVNKLGQTGDFKAISDLISQSKSEGVVLKEPLFILLMKWYGRHSLPGNAAKLLDEMPVKPTFRSYNVAMDILLQAGCYTMVSSLFFRMVNQGTRSTTFTFSVVIKAMCSSSRLDSACALLREMAKHGCVPDSVIYQTLIRSLCQGKRVSDAVRLLEEMILMGCASDAETFNDVVRGLCETGQIRAAGKLVDRMLRLGCAPTAATYGVLLAGLCRGGMVDEAREFLQKVVPSPNTVMFNTVVQGFALEGRLAEAEELVKEWMVPSGCKPDVFTFNILVHGLCKEGRLGTAREMFKGMWCRPDVVSYTVLLHGFCKKGRWEQVKEIMEEMRTGGVRLNCTGLNVLVWRLCRDGMVDEAMEMVRRMKLIGPRPDLVTFNSLIHGLCEENRLEDAWGLFRSLLLEGVAANTVTYNIMIRCLLRRGEWRESMTLVEEMVGGGCGLDSVTYNGLMRALCMGGDVDRALGLLEKMDPVVPTNVTYNILIKGLCRTGRVHVALELLKEMVDRGSTPDLVSYNTVVGGLCRAGRVREAVGLVEKLHVEGVLYPNVVTYNTLMSWHCKRRMINEAVAVLETAVNRGVNPDALTCMRSGAAVGAVMQARALLSSLPTQRSAVPRKKTKTLNLEEAFHGLSLQNTPTLENLSAALELCASKKALFQGRQIHGKSVTAGSLSNDEDEFLATKLTFMYAKCGRTDCAQQLFDEMSHRSIFSWNALMGAYSSSEGHQQKALQVYESLRETGVSPDGCTLATLMKSCGAVGDLRLGSEAHGFAIKCGHLSSSFVLNSILSMYAKCNRFELASKIFLELPDKEDLVSWNAIISASVQCERWGEALRFFGEMQKAEVGLNSYTAVSVLRASKELCLLDLGRELHAFLVKSAQKGEIFAANALLVMYAGCGEMDSSLRVFQEIGRKDMVSWNSLISGFSLNGLHRDVVSHFLKMQEPDKASIVTVVSSLGQLKEIASGKEVHAYAMKHALEDDLQVRNTLINMYARCSCAEYAEKVFNSMTEKDHITWTGMISAYLESFRYLEALNTFREALVEGAEVDPMMVVSVLKALICWEKNSLVPVKEIHAYVIRAGLSDRGLENMFIDAYGTCGEIAHSKTIFQRMKDKDVVSWTSILNACSRNGHFMEAIRLIHQFKESGIRPDAAALVSYLGVISELSSLRKGKEIHALGIRLGFAGNSLAANSLADTYARCGDLRTCRRIFDLAESKDLILWTALIDAYGMHGKGAEAVGLFQEMVNLGIVPDHICFLAVLYACSHAGLVEEGMAYLEMMRKEYKLEPWVEHHVCVVDMLSRSGKVEKAYEFITRMGNDHALLTAAGWSALLGGCRVYSNEEVGRVAVKRLIEVEPERAANYVLAANLLAGERKWEEVDEMRKRMKAKGLKKSPACSWIEMGDEVHTFVAGDRAHPLAVEVYAKLEEITRELEERFGYERDTRFVLKDVEEDEKAELLGRHSERLAITLGLIGGTVGTIRVMKNLRVCGDCHVFCKLVSRMFEREIVLRDASRFHHFKDGACTCGDFW